MGTNERRDALARRARGRWGAARARESRRAGVGRVRSMWAAAMEDGAPHLRRLAEVGEGLGHEIVEALALGGEHLLPFLGIDVEGPSDSRRGRRADEQRIERGPATAQRTADERADGVGTRQRCCIVGASPRPLAGS